MSINRNLKMSGAQCVIEIINLLLLIAFAVTFFVLYPKAAAQIKIEPAAGTIGKIYSYKKSSLLVLLIVCFIVYAVISYMQFFPKLWEVAPEQLKATENLKLMISVTKNIFTAILFYIAIASLSGSILKNWILIAAVAAAACEIAFFLYRYFTLSKDGEKTQD